MSEKTPQKEPPLHEVLFRGQHLLLLRAGQTGDGSARLLKTPVHDAAVPSALVQLTHEYEICRDVDVAGIVRPVSKATIEGRPAVAFEDPGGATLAQVLADGPVELPVFFDIAAQLAGIVGRLHRRGIVHKDIHAGNIIVCADQDPVQVNPGDVHGGARASCPPRGGGQDVRAPKSVQVSLTGLGIAALLPRERVEHIAPDKLEGTLATMSPEQTGRMARPVDFRTDFYSMGVVFYQMLTGRLPFAGDDPLELVHAHLAKEPQAPSKIDPHIPTMVSDLVLKLLAKEADERYRSAAGIVSDLEQCRDDYARTGSVTAFALGHHDISERFHLPDKLYGREEETRALQSAFERTCDGPVELVLVGGYAGIGKTELVNQVRRPVLQRNGFFIAGKCDPLARQIPCAPVVEAFSDWVDQVLALPQDDIDTLRDRLVRALGDNGGVLTEVMPLLSLIVGEQPPAVALPPDQARHRFLLTLQRFVAAAAGAGRPLVLFLDDLQWADFSTLKMLESLASDPDLRHVLLIGAYREQEIDETHGLLRIVKEIEESGGSVHTLALGSPNADALNALIADALHAPPDTTRDLATVCFRKTGGNPFFLKRFLLELVAHQLIFFETTHNAWQWHTDKIEQADVTDNVVELMARTMAKFEKKVRNVLQRAACVGGNFDLGILCEVNEQSPQAILDDLWPAVEAGLVSLLPGTRLRVVPTPDGKTTVPDHGADKALDTIRFRFLHDRVHEAAYGLMDAGQKMDMHLRIGRVMLEQCDPQQLTEKIFDIVSHLNRAVALITTPDDIAALAELNLKAGKRARAMALFESAFEYFRVGIELMTAKDWQAEDWRHHYELTKDLHLNGIEAAFVSGRDRELDCWYARLVEQTRSPLEVIDAYIARIEKEANAFNLSQAVETGVAILARLGIELSADPTDDDFQAELEETERMLSDLSIDEILNLPTMEDPRCLAVLRVMISTLISAYWAKRQLHHIIILKALRLLLRRGNSEFSALIFCYYAFMKTMFQDKWDDVVVYGRLGMRFLDRYGSPQYNNRAKFIFFSSILPFAEHLKTSRDQLKTLHFASIETGNLVVSSTSLTLCELFRFFVGEALEDVDGYMAECRKVLKRIRDKRMLLFLDMHHQMALNLMGKSEHTRALIGEVFDERIYLPRAERDPEQIAVVIVIYFCKLILTYLFEDFQDAIGLAEKIEHAIRSLPNAAPHLSRSHFYAALARLGDV